MGNQKLKWTAEEEEALLAGITKHGAGKWKIILRDAEFSVKLINRSNIDLKDKWRNLCVAPATQALKDKAGPIKVKDEGVAAASNTNSASSPAASLPRSSSSELLSVVDGCNIMVDAKNAPRYDGMIFEALSALTDADGSDVASIFSFIEPRHEVPPNFRRILGSRLRRLAIQGKLVRVCTSKHLQNLYKKPDPSGRRTPKPKEAIIKHRQSHAVSQEMIEEAAITAAYKIVEAENKIDVSKVALEELEKMSKLAEESKSLLEIAKEMHEQCSSGEFVVLV